MVSLNLFEVEIYIFVIRVRLGAYQCVPVERRRYIRVITDVLGTTHAWKMQTCHHWKFKNWRFWNFNS